MEIFNEIILNSIQLNSSSIVYTWTNEDENYCLNIKKFKIYFSPENHHVNPIELFHPLYMGINTIEFTPRRHSTSMTRQLDNTNNIQFITSEIEVNNQINIPTEFSSYVHIINVNHLGNFQV